jgi:glycosyltransferase involved in cell wall biosynthesis
VQPRSIDAGEVLGALRGEVVVLVDGSGRPEQWLPSLTSVVRHTPPKVRIVVYGWGRDPEAAAPGALERLLGPGDEERVYRVPPPLPGAGLGLDEAVTAAAPADVAVVGLGCRVTADWLPRLRVAAGDDAGIATASPVLAASIDRGLAGGGGAALAQAAEAVADASARLRPLISEPAGACCYVRRSAIELAGSPARHDFAEQCSELGLVHVLADDALVAGGIAGAPDGHREDAAADSASVVRALLGARRAARGLSVVVDARVLGGPRNGTRLHVLKLLAAVAATGRVRLTALVPALLDEPTRLRLQGIAGLGLASPSPDGSPPPGLRGDVVHRPHQISTPADFAVLAELGERLVITHQDLISFHTRSYFSTRASWLGYRELTRRALAAADRVVFFSEHVRGEALAEELVEPQRATVVRLGTDHAPAEGVELSPPPGAADLPGKAEVILCLGADYAHKNRPFALRLASELQRAHGWQGRLVLAGQRAAYGSSREHERRLLQADPQLADAVLDLGEVPDEGREWLLGRARLVLYPTVHEGFGLIPHEAALRGVPCLWAGSTALDELLPAAAAAIVPWDPVATAPAALALLRDDRARARNVAAVRAAGTGLGWSATAEQLVEIYERVAAEPAAPAGSLERIGGLMQGGVSEDAMRLVGPDGALPRDLERPLLALLDRPKLSGPLLDAMRVGYRVSRRRARPERPSLPSGD